MGCSARASLLGTRTVPATRGRPVQRRRQGWASRDHRERATTLLQASRVRAWVLACVWPRWRRPRRALSDLNRRLHLEEDCSVQSEAGGHGDVSCVVLALLLVATVATVVARAESGAETLITLALFHRSVICGHITGALSAREAHAELGRMRAD